MIQDFNMNSVGVQPADFVFAPDVTSFDISEFTRADEMALIAEATTHATVANLRKMLNKLDSKLFETSAVPSGVTRGRLVSRTRYPHQAAS
jgi:hypothetical protein